MRCNTDVVVVVVLHPVWRQLQSYKTGSRARHCRYGGHKFVGGGPGRALRFAHASAFHQHVVLAGERDRPQGYHQEQIWNVRLRALSSDQVTIVWSNTQNKKPSDVMVSLLFFMHDKRGGDISWARLEVRVYTYRWYVIFTCEHCLGPRKEIRKIFLEF